MQQNLSTRNKDHVYRVDKFIVPQSARSEFMGRLRATHDLLRKQPGFVREFLLEQTAGPGAFNFVTFVEWESQSAVEQAREAVNKLHRQLNFDPQELRTRLGIRADVANYQHIEL